MADGCACKGKTWKESFANFCKMCDKCAAKKPYMVFRYGAKGGYFWGPGYPDENERGNQPHWMTPTKVEKDK